MTWLLGVRKHWSPVTDANSAWSVDVHPDSVRIARATVTAHHSASLRGWQYHHHLHAQ